MFHCFSVNIAFFLYLIPSFNCEAPEYLLTVVHTLSCFDIVENYENHNAIPSLLYIFFFLYSAIHILLLKPSGINLMTSQGSDTDTSLFKCNSAKR